ncbi:MAG: NAD(P)H-dependent oxidoreductase [Deltaproteobacteria bacterium]
MGSENDILIVYHSQSGNTERLSAAVEEGASRVRGVGVRRARAAQVTCQDLRDSRCLVICSPEYFGYMAGAIKDLFDRTYEEVRDEMVGRSYTVVISAGNDGTGALNGIERIIRGYKLRQVQEPIISRGELSRVMIEKCINLGQTLAAGVELGIY